MPSGLVWLHRHSRFYLCLAGPLAESAKNLVSTHSTFSDCARELLLPATLAIDRSDGGSRKGFMSHSTQNGSFRRRGVPATYLLLSTSRMLLQCPLVYWYRPTVLHTAAM